MLRKLFKGTEEEQKIGRSFVHHPSDFYLVSYPKSGNTWIRFLLGNYWYPDNDFGYGSIFEVLPDVYNERPEHLNTLSHPAVIKSHEYYHPEYRKVVLVVRDPRSVIVSWFHYGKRRGEIPEDLTFNDYFIGFMDGRYAPQEIGNWAENVGSWMGARDQTDDFLLIKYEQLLAETTTEFKRVLEFIGVEVDDEKVNRAVESSSLKKMQGIEKPSTENHTFFARKGMADEWREVLSADQIQIVADRFGYQMRELGYHNL